MGKLFRGRRRVRLAAAPVAVGVVIGSLAAVSGASVRPAAGYPSYPTTLSAADVALAAKYVGGKAGVVAKGTPITIGLLNDDTGTGAIPEGVAGASVAEDLVNHELGGIEGHELAIDECDVSDSTSASSCAAQLVSDHVSLVLTGAVDVQPDTAMYQTLFAAKIPVIVGNSLTPTDFSPPVGTAVSYTPGSPGITLGIGKVIGSGAAGAGLTRVTALYLQGDPASEAAFNLLKSSPYLAGATVVGDAVPSPWSLADVESVTSAARASKPNVLVSLLPAVQCSDLAAAEHALKYAPITVATAACFSDELTTLSSAYPAGWYFVDDGVNPYMYDKGLAVSEQEAVYVGSVATYDSSLDATSPFGSTAFDTVLTAARLLAKAGTTVSTKVLTNLVQNFSGPQWGIPGPITCGTVSALTFPSSCAADVGVERLVGTAASPAWEAVQDAYNDKLVDPFPAPACVGTGGCDVTSTSPTFICLTVASCPAGGTTVSTVSVGAFMNGRRAPNEPVTVHFLSSSTPSSSGSWCQHANGSSKTGETNAQGVFQFTYTSAGPGSVPPIASFCIIKATIGKASIFGAIDQTNDPAAWKVKATPRKVTRVAVPSDRAGVDLSVLNSQHAPVFNDPTTFLYSMIPSTVGACGSVNPMVKKTKHPHGRAALVYTPSTVYGTRSHPVTCTLIGQEADTSRTSNRLVIYQNKP